MNSRGVLCGCKKGTGDLGGGDSRVTGRNAYRMSITAKIAIPSPQRRGNTCAISASPLLSSHLRSSVNPHRTSFQIYSTFTASPLAKSMGNPFYFTGEFPAWPLPSSTLSTLAPQEAAGKGGSSSHRTSLPLPVAMEIKSSRPDFNPVCHSHPCQLPPKPRRPTQAVKDRSE